MTVMTGKHAMMEMLRAEGVRYVFGNPGTSESAMMDAIEHYPDLEYVLVTQEGVAVGMADSYGRATGKPSFLNLHIETGLANAISLLHNAMEGGSPMVVTSGNKDIRELAHERTDLAAMVEQFTKWTAEATYPGAGTLLPATGVQRGEDSAYRADVRGVLGEFDGQRCGRGYFPLARELPSDGAGRAGGGESGRHPVRGVESRDDRQRPDRAVGGLGRGSEGCGTAGVPRAYDDHALGVQLPGEPSAVPRRDPLGVSRGGRDAEQGRRDPAGRQDGDGVLHVSRSRDWTTSARIRS